MPMPLRTLKSILPSSLLLLVVLLVFAYWFSFNRIIASDAPRAEKGGVDLSGWSWTDRGIVPLNGQWEFYGGQLLEPADFEDGTVEGEIGAGIGAGDGRPVRTGYAEVPGPWVADGEDGDKSENGKSPYGYGTYRLRIRLPESDSHRIYGIVVNNIKTSHRLFADGEPIGEGGVPGESKAETKAVNLPYSRFFQQNGGTAEIVIQVANFSYAKGGITHPVYLGEQARIVSYRDYSIALDAIVGLALFILGCYFLVLYRMRRREKPWLLFGLSCLANSVYILTHGDKLLGLAFPAIPYEWFTKTQFLSGILSEYFLLRYTRTSYSRLSHKRIVRAFEWELAARFAVVLAAPASVYSNADWVYYLLSFALMFYAMYVMVAGAVRKLEGAALMAISALFLFLINMGSYLYNGGAMEAYFMQPLAFMGFMFAQVVLLSKRFTNAFATVELLSEKLKSLDKLKDEFLANTSHELRTPLHGMINIAESLLGGAAGKLSPGQEENLSLIVASGKRMANLVNDILDFSKLRNGEIVLRTSPVDVRPLVGVIFEMFRHLAGKKPVRLADRLPADLPPVLADEDRLTQILFNLIGNALKFTKEGEVAVFAHEKNGVVTIGVKDTGIGIAKDRQEAIFDSFEQADSGIASEYGGMGMGLSVTKSLVELHGGRIRVESEPGAGSVFSFTLPAAGEAAAAEAARSDPGDIGFAKREAVRAASGSAAAASASRHEPSAPKGRGSEFTILIADDDAANRQVLLNLLTLEGYSVVAAADGAEALCRLDERRPFDLLVVDLMMPGLSGYDVCRAVRGRYSLSELPVLILTARNRAEDMLAGFAAGANDFLGKPVEAEELRARVRTLLGMKKSAADLIRSELDFLRAQIKPHFLFNTINTVISVSHRNAEEARQLLTKLGTFLRESFDFDNGEQRVPLHRELDLVRAYLFIEQARFGERLRVEYAVDEEADAEIPPLILQPIVENAVRHGVTKRPEGGTVRIVARRAEEGGLVLVVEDDGPGMEAGAWAAASAESRIATGESLIAAAESRAGRRGSDSADARQVADARSAGRTRQGVGLANIDRRLRTLYGTGLDIASAPGEGTRVTIRIPG
ncbi:hypothetical protein J19TS2_19230 [Cohnella xylanilytica]|uniref:ATP-binding protein n=1 Tax=Cohnella xylanilytica TaxID=557555 RepID=UPI001B20ADF4|nr:ATP-binding protein [Cohnella xylanilytica]GIO12368.1 hypothetical protein J19TS2_19230 [Cohnella xylanilytica]